MSSQTFGTSKQHGVICTHPGCFRFLQTTKFKQHYESHHLAAGESYSSRHRDDYERALLDPNLLEWGDDGPLKAVFVASLTRVSHYLDDMAGRLELLETAVTALASTTSAAAVEPAAPDAPEPEPHVTAADEQVQESDTDDERRAPPPPPKGMRKATRKEKEKEKEKPKAKKKRNN